MDLHTLFNCFIVGGFVVPVLNMVTGVIGGALGGGTDLDADADFDIDPDMDIDPVPDLDADLATDVDPAAGAGYGKLPVNLMTLWRGGTPASGKAARAVGRDTGAPGRRVRRIFAGVVRHPAPEAQSAVCHQYTGPSGAAGHCAVGGTERFYRHHPRPQRHREPCDL